MSSSKDQRAGSLQGLAHMIARRLQAMRDIASEKNEQPRAEDLAHQFRVMCERATLSGAPITTAEMALLASELIPEAASRLREPIAA
jgi:chorismate mutase